MQVDLLDAGKDFPMIPTTAWHARTRYAPSSCHTTVRGTVQNFEKSPSLAHRAKRLYAVVPSPELHPNGPHSRNHHARSTRASPMHHHTVHALSCNREHFRPSATCIMYKSMYKSINTNGAEICVPWTPATGVPNQTYLSVLRPYETYVDCERSSIRLSFITLPTLTASKRYSTLCPAFKKHPLARSSDPISILFTHPPHNRG